MSAIRSTPPAEPATAATASGSARCPIKSWSPALGRDSVSLPRGSRKPTHQRLVGLPNEVVKILRRHLRPGPDDADCHAATAEKLLAMMQTVYDNDYVSSDVGQRLAARKSWSQQDAAGDWTPARTLALIAPTDSKPAGVDGYQHIVPPESIGTWASGIRYASAGPLATSTPSMPARCVPIRTSCSAGPHCGRLDRGCDLDAKPRGPNTARPGQRRTLVCHDRRQDRPGRARRRARWLATRAKPPG